MKLCRRTRPKARRPLVCLDNLVGYNLRDRGGMTQVRYLPRYISSNPIPPLANHKPSSRKGSVPCRVLDAYLLLVNMTSRTVSMDAFLGRPTLLSSDSEIIRSIELPPSPELSQTSTPKASQPAVFEINWTRIPNHLNYSRPTKRPKRSWIWDHGADLVDHQEKRFWLCRRCTNFN